MANFIYETRTEKMVSHKDGKCKERTGRFLKPTAKIINQAMKVPETPLICEIFPQELQQWPTKVLFKGWKIPQKNWKDWVDRLSVKYVTIWKQTGICEAIMSSIYEVRYNGDSVLGLSEFWCSETNTFVFPWGEATITLEDVMILGGLPVIGELVTMPLKAELANIEEELNKKRREVSRGKQKKATFTAWLNHFVECESHDLEHVAFLSLWLSRYVFPSLPEETLGKHVFPIAIHLSRGTPMALAPPVLARIYQDLSLLKEQSMKSVETVVVSGPFQLVLLWLFERFPVLGPRTPCVLEPGEPRIARFHKLNSRISLPLVRSVLKLEDNFRWRPYAANLMNWRHSSCYKDTEQVLIYSSSSDDELRSFARCLHSCELVGLDCNVKEKYLPHRVARQFGFDQDLPGSFNGQDTTLENVGFFVPPRSFEASVSSRYFNWWKDSIIAREDAIKNVLARKRTVNFGISPLVQERSSKDDCHSSIKSNNTGGGITVIPEFSPEVRTQVLPCVLSDDDDDDLPISVHIAKVSSIKTQVESKVLPSVLAKHTDLRSPNKVVKNSNGEESQASTWWKDSIIAREDAIKNVLARKRTVNFGISPLVQERSSKDDCHSSIKSNNTGVGITVIPEFSPEVRRQVLPCVLSDDDDDDDLPISVHIAKVSSIKTQVESKVLPSVLAEHTGLRSPNKVVKNSNGEESQASTALEFSSKIKTPTSQDLGDDDSDIPIPRRPTKRVKISKTKANLAKVLPRNDQSKNSASLNSSLNVGSKKRKFPTRTREGGIVQSKATTHCGDGDANEVEEDGYHHAKKSVKGGADKGKKIMAAAGESINNPIVLEDQMIRSSNHTLAHDHERRLKEVEKILGLNLE